MDDETRTTLIKRTIERLRGVAGTLERGGPLTRIEAGHLAERVQAAVSTLVAVYNAPMGDAPDGDDEDDEDAEAPDEEPEPVRLLRVPEVAELLGLSAWRVEQLVLREEIASVKIGRARRIPNYVVDAYLAAHPVPGGETATGDDQDDQDDQDDGADEDASYLVPEEKRPILITVPEAAARLGLGRTTVQSLVLRGELASLQIGRARRIPVWAIDDYMATHLRAGDG